MVALLLFICSLQVLSESAITTNLTGSVFNCVGGSQNMAWTYDEPSGDLPSLVTWKKDAAIIFSLDVADNDKLIPENGYDNGKITHHEKGNITLNNLLNSDTGSYSCEVTYNTGRTEVSNKLVLTVYAKVTTKLTCEYLGDTISCSVPDSSILLQVNKTTTTLPFRPLSQGVYEMCMTGGASVCLGDNIDNCVYVYVPSVGLTQAVTDCNEKTIGLSAGCLCSTGIIIVVLNCVLLLKCLSKPSKISSTNDDTSQNCCRKGKKTSKNMYRTALFLRWLFTFLLDAMMYIVVACIVLFPVRSEYCDFEENYVAAFIVGIIAGVSLLSASISLVLVIFCFGYTDRLVPKKVLPHPTNPKSTEHEEQQPVKVEQNSQQLPSTTVTSFPPIRQFTQNIISYKGSQLQVCNELGLDAKRKTDIFISPATTERSAHNSDMICRSKDDHLSPAAAEISKDKKNKKKKKKKKKKKSSKDKHK